MPLPFHSFITAGLDLLFPPTCVACQTPGALLCNTCAQAVQPVVQPFCQRCGRAQTHLQEPLCHLCQKDENPVLNRVRAAAFHTEPLRTIIHHFKYGNQPELAKPLVRYLLAAYAAADWRRLIRIDAVVPVPMFAERQRERGYNQAELLARQFCKQTKLPLATTALQRVRFTQPQVGLNAKERQQNVEDVFVAHSTVKGKTLLLIDDVYTTGATLRSCASSAAKAGAASIYALAVAIPLASESK